MMCYNRTYRVGRRGIDRQALFRVLKTETAHGKGLIYMSEKNKRDLKVRTGIIRSCLLVIIALITIGTMVGVTNYATAQKEEIRQQVGINEGIKTNEKIILWRTNGGRYMIYLGGFRGEEIAVNQASSMELIDRFVDITDHATYLMLVIMATGAVLFISILQAKDRTVRRIALAISLTLLYSIAAIYYTVRFIALTPVGIYYLVSQAQLTKKRHMQSRA